MREIKIDELKKIQIEILEHVHDFCVDNRIDYFLDCGTLIGAIRHHGYIPWDDDIDIGMLRPAYEKFAESFNRFNKRYKFLSLETDSDYSLAHGKVVDTRTVLYEPNKEGRKLAVNIDVFVYDNAPIEQKLIEKQYKNRNFLRACNIARVQGNDVEKGVKRAIGFAVLHFLTRLFPKTYFARKMSENAQKYNKTETGQVGNFTSYSTIVCTKDVFDSFIDCEYEGKIYKIPIGYDKWLRTFYGDYMKLPPEEKRISTHHFEAYYLD